MLHVPSISDNLLTISRITNDNNAIVEFDSHCLYVKDKGSKKVLLKGMLKNGLYRVLVPSPLSKPKETNHLISRLHVSQSQALLFFFYFFFFYINYQAFNSHLSLNMCGIID